MEFTFGRGIRSAGIMQYSLRAISLVILRRGAEWKKKKICVRKLRYVGAQRKIKICGGVAQK